MAIAQVNGAAAYRSTGATSHTFAFDSGLGSDKATAIFIRTYGSDSASGVTYGGTAMTQVNKQAQGTSGDYGYMYYLPASTNGSNNFVVSLSASERIQWAASSYSGVLQSDVDGDATNKTSGTSGTTASVALTSIADNCWHIFGYVHNAGATDSGSNYTARGYDNSNGTVGIGDNNSAKTPAGSLTQSVTWTGAQQYAAISMTIAPSATASTATTSSLLLSI